MNGRDNRGENQERAIADLLHFGVWLASIVIGAGLAADWLHILTKKSPLSLSGGDVVKAGVALLILLPVTRVALMFCLFVRERDATYMVISALVLTIIGAGFLAGL